MKCNAELPGLCPHKDTKLCRMCERRSPEHRKAHIATIYAGGGKRFANGQTFMRSTPFELETDAQDWIDARDNVVASDIETVDAEISHITFHLELI